MDRILASPETLRCDEPALPRQDAQHLKALRLKPGETVELFDGAGAVRPFAAGPGGTLKACGGVAEFPRPAMRISLYACVSKGSRWDWTVEKAVELGVSRIVPVISSRTIVRIAPGAERAAKAARWRRVAADAARQSHAVWLPDVDEPTDFPAAVADAAAAAARGTALFGAFLSDPPPPPILQAWNAECAARGAAVADAAVFIGPEGDFSPEETEALAKAGATPVSLGPTVLRTETAAIYACAVLAAAGAAGPSHQSA